MVKGDIIVTEQKEYKTDCEIVWVKIEIVGTRPLFIAAYYRSKEGDSYSARASTFTKFCKRLHEFQKSKRFRLHAITVLNFFHYRRSVKSPFFS